ncbi:polyketide cyclase [Pseudonocardia sp. CNS-139]|nr:polyketide cyclase [Pseudonocardia sp. CNS-139]
MTSTAPSPVQSLLDAVNRGDTDGFLGCFTPDGVVDDWGREFRGPQAIRTWSDGELIGVRASLQVTAVNEHEGAVVVTALVGGDGFKGPSHFAFDVSGDRVARMTIRA